MWQESQPQSCLFWGRPLTSHEFLESIFHQYHLSSIFEVNLLPNFGPTFHFPLHHHFPLHFPLPSTLPTSLYITTSLYTSHFPLHHHFPFPSTPTLPTSFYPTTSHFPLHQHFPLPPTPPLPSTPTLPTSLYTNTSLYTPHTGVYWTRLLLQMYS